MATSGSLFGNNVDGSEGSYLNWQLSGQNVDNLYSIVNWQVGWRFSTTGCRGLRLGNAIMNGTTVYNDSDGGDGVHGFVSGHNHRPTLQTASGTVHIVHNDDGTKQFAGSVRMTGFSGHLSQGSNIWSLPTINRLPHAPSNPTFSDTKQTSTVVTFTPNYDGGSPITAYQVGYGLTSSADTTTIAATSPQLVSSLLPARKYYFRVRAQNSVGFGPWSGITNVTTLAGVRINVGGVWKSAVPYVKVGGIWKVSRPWAKSAGVWKETT